MGDAESGKSLSNRQSFTDGGPGLDSHILPSKLSECPTMSKSSVPERSTVDVPAKANSIRPPSVPSQNIQVREGLAHPRGATWDGEGVNFALFSAHATKASESKPTYKLTAGKFPGLLSKRLWLPSPILP
jgi:hypothetical protein